MARLLSVNVGLPRDIFWNGRTVHTSIRKEPVQGRRRVRRLNIDGDGQGDLACHGGEHRAVFVYQGESYRSWERRLGRNDFAYGQFSENFTIDGLPDDPNERAELAGRSDIVMSARRPTFSPSARSARSRGSCEACRDRIGSCEQACPSRR